VRAPGSGSALGSVAAGLASVATLPVAIYATRFSDAYELLDAGWAIPVAAVLGSSRSHRSDSACNAVCTRVHARKMRA
jgi:hypothetical protein